jgi:hypothetical protein
MKKTFWREDSLFPPGLSAGKSTARLVAPPQHEVGRRRLLSKSERLPRPQIDTVAILMCGSVGTD